MSMGQLILTMLVALLVFGPTKLPMLARHLGRVFAKFNYYKQQVILSWQKQLQDDIKEQQLLENIKKAKKADTSYTER
ncbi:MAG: twin-arginine translocase TatA/TatE family subunit [Legionellaceae bacterium]|nr:twin-arginine translocase TatA/TatE family subunit [Legionellaceae bacterium]